ncbi:MAG: DNA polymerase I, partial [Clostridia bacterium]|nr:DNA polymerase I [Clostridia bacterium]
KSPNKQIQAANERIALNSPLQGTAADIIKIAMIRVFDRLKEAGIDARLILQVHDELILDCDASCAETAKEILLSSMESVYNSKVRLKVSLAEGANWYDAK